jgi:hypothetical protein
MPAGLVCCPRLLWPCCPRLTPASQLHSPALPRLLQPEDYYLQDDTVPLVNISFGAVLCSALLACWLVFVRRVYRSNLTGKRWSHRRRRAATMAGIELTLQLVNCIFFVVPNAWVLAHECSWMEPVVVWAGFVRWAGGRVGRQPDGEVDRAAWLLARTSRQLHHPLWKLHPQSTYSAAQVDNLEYAFSHVLDRGLQRLPRSLPPLECVPPLPPLLPPPLPPLLAAATTPAITPQ